MCRVTNAYVIEISHVVVFYWQCTKNCYLAIGRILCCVSGHILLFNLFKCKFCKWMKLKVCSMPNSPPPSFFSVDNPRRIWFPLLLQLMLKKTDTVHLTTCSLSCIWCFLKDRYFFRCSRTSGPWNRTCIIGYTFELLLFLFLIFLNSFPMPAIERATSPPLFEPEEGNSKLPKREMSFSVPSFCAAFILSMGSFLQVTFFIDKIKQTRNYHVRKQLRHNVKK